MRVAYVVLTSLLLLTVSPPSSASAPNEDELVTSRETEPQRLARERKEVQATIDRALAHQKQSRHPSSSTSSVTLILKPRAEFSDDHMRLVHDCKVFEWPSVASKVLTSKKAGTQLSRASSSEHWVGFAWQGRRVYIARNCF